jgi:hypothetical protein
MAAFGALIDPILALLLVGATPSAPPDAPRAPDAAPGAVRGIVFEDLIGNGCFGGDVGNMLFDPGEPLAHDVAVLLRRPDGSIDRTLAPGGRFAFEGLEPGIYTVEVDGANLPPGGQTLGSADVSVQPGAVQMTVIGVCLGHKREGPTAVPECRPPAPANREETR